ncbi:MAG TPA: superoxide dismutase family protein [Thermoleophilaceae bacterium]|nr:superoxide dismutase family protein [Thermoleophilaceae bacterium]
MTLTLGTLAGCGDDQSPSERPAARERQSVDVKLELAEGGSGGSASLTETEGGVEVRAELRGLEPGFHGFHVHEAGVCDPEAREGGERAPFSSAMGHLAGDGADHGAHAGDLPTVLVRKEGTASLTVVTDRLRLPDVRDQDGSALMVHAMGDNQANIPERYKSEGKAGPDAETLDTGDAGDRVACGVIKR